MSTLLPHQRNGDGLTLLELLVIVAAIAILATLALPYFSHFSVGRPGTRQLGDGRILYLSLRNYASDADHDGAFPAFDGAGRSLFATSSAVFESLIPQYLDDKSLLFNKRSAWCAAPNASHLNDRRVEVGDNDWCYVRGLREASPKHWPLLANAFAPGTLTYIGDTHQRGGVWKGEQAIVIWANGSGEIVKTRKIGERFYVARPDDPTANAFEKSRTWLTGETVEVLFPRMK